MVPMSQPHVSWWLTSFDSHFRCMYYTLVIIQCRNTLAYIWACMGRQQNHWLTDLYVTHKQTLIYIRMQISPCWPAGSSKAFCKWSKPPCRPCLYRCVPLRLAWVWSLQGATGERRRRCMALIVNPLWGLPEPHIQHPKYYYSPWPVTPTYAYLPSH